ncbi:MAG: histidine kinase [Pseudomonadales bacterium]
MSENREFRHPFMPDLCRLPVVLGVLAVTQLLVIVHVLSLNAMSGFDWELLSLLSLYAQWLSMLSIALLCNLRPLINRLPTPAAAALSFGIILLVAALTNAVAQWIYHGRSWGNWSGQWLLRDLVIIAVIAGIALRYVYVQQQWLREESASDNAKLDALHARIRPHFLFNSMNTIASLIRFAPGEAEAAVEDLAALMRASLSERHLLVPWTQELAICEAYLRIEQLRLGERLQVNWRLQALPFDFMLPPLVVQPLLENAIYHGIEKRPDGGVIDISAQQHGDTVSIEVCNTVAPSAQGDPGERHNGIALQNIRARLAGIYRVGEDGRNHSALELAPDESVFIARLAIPYGKDTLV